MLKAKKEPRNLKGTWNQAILTFLFPLLLIFGIRWAVFEPFVIPSGSMIPNLLVHDHILVQKFAFGLHVPFSDKWLVQWSQPEKGQIIVFKYPKNPEVYYIKRLIGVPGDKIEVQNGRISLNGEKLPLMPFSAPDNESQFEYFDESLNGQKHTVRFLLSNDVIDGIQQFEIPPGHYFFMGDNRDQSSDSRYWGFVKNEYIVGKAQFIWLSCENSLPTMSFMCDPSQIRFQRLFQKIN